MTNYGCKILNAHHVNQAGTGLTCTKEWDILTVDRKTVDLCLNCPLSECFNEIRDRAKMKRGLPV